MFQLSDKVKNENSLEYGLNIEKEEQFVKKNCRHKDHKIRKSPLHLLARQPGTRLARLIPDCRSGVFGLKL
jgi:hypothetical protein